MNGTEAVQSEDLIQGKCIINGHLVNVLYDIGVSQPKSRREGEPKK